MSNSSTTRDRVVDEALRLFATRGFAATSIADVAEASGLLKGNLAYYFKSKKDLLDAVLDKRSKTLWAELVEPAQEGEDARTTITRLLQHVRDTAEELALYGCPVGGLSTELGKTDADLHSPAASLLLQLENYLREAFAQVLPKAQAQRAAEHLLSVLQGAAVVAQARRDPGVVHRQVDEATAWLGTVLQTPKQQRVRGK
ncbi:TetR/AcrR family transcriptional regulator [Paucibacter sediminis]|uniref:TetR/AcrR family transcriptional regulator n=1 Tax=Paucibacter sediminis TaxID=3019553 RepID=A0AA95SN94_9BURK|nr:TetR/AcrR family transcriptional regulator [Paucibacter sp. S2-9]WIT14123.1 TetR/AcrR family transcriptional regulator [Paucibacter sp. S2-9]